MDLDSIKNLVIGESGRLNTNYKIILNKHQDMVDYLYKYYNCNNLSECIYRLRYNIINQPVCPVCGNIIQFNGRGYNNTCSIKCGVKNSYNKIKRTKLERYGNANYNNRDKMKQTKLDRYDNANYVNTEKAKETKLIHFGNANYVNPQKAKQTKLERYGNANYVNTEKIKSTNINKYGVDCILKLDYFIKKSKETKLERYGNANYVNPQKAKQTNLIRYGVTCTLHNDIIKQKTLNTNRQKYGADNFVQSVYWQKLIHNKQWQDKRKQAELNTKRKNHTFNVSKPEDECYELLCSKFGIENIKRQYRSELYPYCCDFYVSSINLYIECNFHWTHGPHLYNKNNIKDIVLKCRWNHKAKKSKFYYNALKTWTVRDIKKQETAKQNKLNWVSFYSKIEFINYINSI